MRGSQTRLEAWEGCRRAYYFSYEERLQSKRPSLSAHRGTAVHKALAAHYAGGDEARVVSAFDVEMEKFPDKEGDWKETRDKWLKKVVEYRNHHLVEPFEVLGIEEEVERKVPGTDCTIMGIFDLRVRMKRDGTIWAVDHKTADRTGPAWWTQWFVSKQISCYIWLRPEVSGVLLNVVKSTKTESFEREGFSRAEEQLRAFERQSQYEIFDMIQAREELKEGIESREELMAKWFPQATQHCHKGWGSCVFLPICQGGDAAKVLFEEKRYE